MSVCCTKVNSELLLVAHCTCQSEPSDRPQREIQRDQGPAVRGGTVVGCVDAMLFVGNRRNTWNDSITIGPNMRCFCLMDCADNNTTVDSRFLAVGFAVHCVYIICFVTFGASASTCSNVYAVDTSASTPIPMGFIINHSSSSSSSSWRWQTKIDRDCPPLRSRMWTGRQRGRTLFMSLPCKAASKRFLFSDALLYRSLNPENKLIKRYPLRTHNTTKNGQESCGQNDTGKTNCSRWYQQRLGPSTQSAVACWTSGQFG